MSFTQYDLNKIEFKNEKAFLSNMYPAPIRFDTYGIVNDIQDVELTNLIYPSSEHLYQALKCKDIRWHKILLENLNPHSTKAKARKMLRFTGTNNISTFLIREDFHNIKDSIMLMIVYLKFKQNQALADKLLSLDPFEDIQERNCWNDTYWGTVNNEGKNKLGKILMQVRDILNKEKEDGIFYK